MLLSGCAGLTITKTESFGIGQLWNKAASLRDCYRNPALHPKLRDNIQNRTVPKVWDFGSLFWIFLIPFLWPGLTFWTLQPLGKVKTLKSQSSTNFRGILEALHPLFGLVEQAFLLLSNRYKTAKKSPRFLSVSAGAIHGQVTWLAVVFLVIPPFVVSPIFVGIWAMVNTHYMVDGHPIHNKDPYNGYPLVNKHRPWQIGVGRLVSIKHWWFSGSMFIYQRVL